MTNRRKPLSGMDPQRRHDQALRVPEPDKIASRSELEALLRKINGPSMEPSLPGTNKPITVEGNLPGNATAAVVMVRVMRNNPGLTREEAEEIIRASGWLNYDPIASAMERHPGLTREKAEEMARAFGF